MADSVYRYSLAYLPPRTDNDNPFRRRWDIITAQRNEMIESLRFLISVQAHNDSAEAGDKMDKLFSMYKKALFPEDSEKQLKETTDLFAPWKGFFGKEISIKEQEDIRSRINTEKTFKIKNLSKL